MEGAKAIWDITSDHLFVCTRAVFTLGTGIASDNKLRAL